uniref:Uncharacterized protein n=1 Tax=Panthera leo TaxID=9689 RepID=A0A8C8XQS4_PANLE
MAASLRRLSFTAFSSSSADPDDEGVRGTCEDASRCKRCLPGAGLGAGVPGAWGLGGRWACDPSVSGTSWCAGRYPSISGDPGFTPVKCTEQRFIYLTGNSLTSAVCQAWGERDWESGPKPGTRGLVAFVRLKSSWETDCTSQTVKQIILVLRT